MTLHKKQVSATDGESQECEGTTFFTLLKDMLGVTNQQIQLNIPAPAAKNLADVYIVDAYQDKSLIRQKDGTAKFGQIYTTGKEQLHFLVSMDQIIKKVSAAINGPYSNN
jgi:hypothetical protein